MSKKKVLILVNHDVVIYNFRKELVERLLQEGYEVVISSPYGERIDELIEMGCEYSEVSIDRHGTSILTEAKLLKYYISTVKAIKPDMVFTYTIKPNIYGGIAAQLFNVPYVANITGLGTAVEHEGNMQKLSIFLYKLAFKRIKKIFFQNTDNRQFFIDNNIGIEKHGLLPGSGVNLRQFSIMEYPEEKTIEFVFLSRIMQEKGIEHYLDAAKYIRKKYPHTRFHICGFCEEDYHDTLKSLEKDNIVQYHGMVLDIKGILKKTHCTIHPTYYPEGLSNVLLESLACGRPIITTDRSGCREVVNDGVNGYLVEQKNSEKLIEKIEQFLKLDHKSREKMGIQGRKLVEKEFDRQIVVDEYLKEVRQV